MGPLLIGIVLLTLMIWHVTWVARRLLHPTLTHGPTAPETERSAPDMPAPASALDQRECALTRQLLAGRLDRQTYQRRMRELADEPRNQVFPP